MKKIAVIGSSGGNLFRQGGDNPNAMMNEIFTQAGSAGIEVAHVVFIGAGTSMDNISADAQAKLYTLENGELVSSSSAKLSETNMAAITADKIVASEIMEGNIDALVLMSCDPDKVNKNSIDAAVEKRIPIVGTGGTSIGKVQSNGGKVISASGTTGTTNRTRAVAFVAALAKEFKLKYSPIIGDSAGSGEATGNVWKRINFRGIMMAAMPGFIAMALILAVSKIPGLEFLGAIFSALSGVLPVILAAIAAKQISGLDEVGIVAGIVAGIMSVSGGIIGGLVSGIIAGVLTYYIATLCFKWKFPATTVSIAAGALGGLFAGLIGMYLISPAALWLGEGIKTLIDVCLSYNAVLAGAVAGLLIWPAIIGGVYHAAILPIVLLEMESAGFSFLGAVDMTGLVMVSAGITLANIIFPRQKGDRAAAVPGFGINMFFGTFVEAAYPYMFSNKLVFGGAILASTVSGALIGMLGVRGTAYVPTFVAPFMANDGKGIAFAICMLVAMAIAFVVTGIANKTTVKKLK